MSSGLFGGGFFFTPFTLAFNNEITLVASGVPGVPGVWTLLYGPTPAHGRWADLKHLNPSAATVYNVDLGVTPNILVPPVTWLPLPGIGFRSTWAAPGALIPWSWSFPWNVPPAQNLVARLTTANAVADTIDVQVAIFG